MKTLIASSGSIEGIKKCIADFWCTKPERVELSEELPMTVSLGGKLMDGLVVEQKKNRFRFGAI